MIKLEKFVAVVNAVAAGNSKGIGREKAAVRETRMKAFFTAPENAVFWKVGKFLANTVDGKTLAEYVLAGETIGLEEIVVDGRSLPLADGYAISLANIRSVWGCAVCQSAHGSGVTPSPEKNASLLAVSEFYYNPRTKALFTISAWCFDKWVKGLGFDTKARFITVPKADPIPPAEQVKAPNANAKAKA